MRLTGSITIVASAGDLSQSDLEELARELRAGVGSELVGYAVGVTVEVELELAATAEDLAGSQA